jgi:DNA (cytosine-5)-methyltransferase 1
MREDYRNYLFESYIRILNHFKPSLFVFENVMGMLSAAPDGTPIVDKIREAFDKAGYLVIDDFKDAVFDVADFGIPQHRKRVIILGVNKVLGKSDNVLCKKILDEFYNVLMPLYKKKAKPRTVRSAIGDMPAIFPRKEVLKKEGHKYSHQPIDGNGMMNHIPRFHSERDQKIFTMLAEDIESGRNQYVSTDSLKELYTKMTGKKSNIHKYYVLRWNEPSNTIPAHLYKDGMRHIHPDPAQARSITVREAARLQTFADDFEFLGPMMAQYKMIGNAVPSDFAKIIAKGVKEIMTKYL